jgi:hypothetical protein
MINGGLSDRGKHEQCDLRDLLKKKNNNTGFQMHPQASPYGGASSSSQFCQRSVIALHCYSPECSGRVKQKLMGIQKCKDR